MKKEQLVLLLAVVAAAMPGVAAEDASKTVFAQKCASCHGKDGKGNPAMAKMFKLEPAALDLTSKAVTEKKDEDLIGLTSKGKGKMPAYATKLKPEEIKGLVAYIRTLSAPKPK